jgi:hypothetical protein
MTTPDGRTIQLPPGVTQAQVRALFQKRFGGGTLTPQEQQQMQQIQRAFGGGGGGRPGMGGGANGGMRRGGSDYQFGGNYIVFLKRGDEISLVHVRTGLTDLDFSEVTTGLQATDSVLILPSASMVQSQEEFRQRMGSFAGQGVPGMRQQTTPAAGAAGAAAARPPAGGPRP